MPSEVKENTFDLKLKRLDVIFKGATALVLVIGVVLGYFQFQDIRRQETAQREKELNTLLYKTQLELYLQITDVTARFSLADSRTEADTARKEFWTLYYGKLSIVEDEGVKQQMILFGLALKDWEEGTMPPNDFTPPEDYNEHIPDKDFRQLSYTLTQKCRDHLNAAFKEQLPTLSSGKP